MTAAFAVLLEGVARFAAGATGAFGAGFGAFLGGVAERTG